MIAKLFRAQEDVGMSELFKKPTHSSISPEQSELNEAKVPRILKDKKNVKILKVFTETRMFCLCHQRITAALQSRANMLSLS